MGSVYFKDKDGIIRRFCGTTPIYNWVDGQNTELTSSGTTSLTNIDMSSIIDDYDSNGEYEILITTIITSSNSNTLKMGSDIITPFSINQINANGLTRTNVIIPCKRYLSYQNTSSSVVTYINLGGYRRIK